MLEHCENASGGGNMNWNGPWDPSAEYGVGKIVSRDGQYYVAIQPNTGEDPKTAPNYWQYFGEESPPEPVPAHNDLEGLDGIGTYHISANAAGAAEHAENPGPLNPYVTRSQMPELNKSVAPFARVQTPPRECSTMRRSGTGASPPSGKTPF
jgi:hypothetical protein